MSFLSAIVCCLLSSFLSFTDGQSTGALRLYRNGVGDTHQSWSSGIIQIYQLGAWDTMCDDSSFGSDEADVICHQLGYTGASSYSNTGTTTTWGTGPSTSPFDTKLTVSCLHSTYLTITQCSFGSVSTSNCSDYLTVSCYSTRIWDSPSPGDIRLTGGTYSNQGLLEVYCNGQWGTVCDDYFYSTQARVACRQLGYNYYDNYDRLDITGNSSQPIFLRYLSQCFSSDDCLTQCGGCPSSGISGCRHYEDVTLQCRYSSLYSKVNTKTSNYCQFYDTTVSTGVLIGIVVGSIVGVIVCMALIIIIPICIFVCVGVAANRVSKQRPKSTSVANVNPPPDPDNIIVQNEASNQHEQQPYYPADPDLGNKSTNDAPPGYYDQPVPQPAPPPKPYDVSEGQPPHYQPPQYRPAPQGFGYQPPDV